MAQNISLPDFDLSGFYYPEIIENLVLWARVNVPELSSEDPRELHIQFMRAFALVGHLVNTNIDHSALELTLPTSKTKEGVRVLTALIDYIMSGAKPARVDLTFEITTIFSVTTTLVQRGDLFQTRPGVSGGSPVPFSATKDRSTADMTVMEYGSYVDSAGLTIDVTSEIQSAAGSPFTFPVNGNPNAVLHFGNRGFMWQEFDVNVTTGLVGATGVWEYYNPNFSSAPSLVTVGGSGIKFELDTLFDSGTNFTGASVTVTMAKTGRKLLISSTFATTNEIDTASSTDPFLGQISPSSVAADYVVTVDWIEPQNLVDNTTGLTTVGQNTVSYDLPQSLTRNWTRWGGVAASFADDPIFLLRFRIATSPGPVTDPVIEEIGFTADTTYTGKLTLTQGRRKVNATLATGTGAVNQEYQLSLSPVISGTVEITIDGDEWLEKDSLISSRATDKHYAVEINTDGIATIKFGDGQTGSIPGLGAVIAADYRYDADVLGNIGAGLVVTNAAGISFISSLTNPRPAYGWISSDWATDEKLAETKVKAPASLRALSRGITPVDIESLAVLFTASDGSNPIARAIAREELYGRKTVGLIVVGAEGASLPTSSLTDIDTYFNGSTDGETDGVLMMNHQVVSVNYIKRVIPITLTVHGGGNQLAIETALRNFVNPLAKKAEDSAQYQHSFNGRVARSKIDQIVHDTSVDITYVEIAAPAADVILADFELPSAGAISITFVTG